MPTIDELNGKITDAIYFAEGIYCNEGYYKARSAFRDLAILEKELADQTDAGSNQGDVARRGAVGAAIRAGDFELAKTYINAFLGEDGASERLKNSLLQLQANIEKVTTES